MRNVIRRRRRQEVTRLAWRLEGARALRARPSRAHCARADRSDHRLRRDARRAGRGPAHDRLWLLGRQRRPHPRLFSRHDRRRRGARARVRRPILPGDDAWRRGGRRPSRRSLHPSDPARRQLLRRGEDRRHRLAPLRRHDAAQGDVRLFRVARAAQSVPVRRRDHDDGGDEPETVGLRAGGDSHHRAPALRGRALGARALPPRPGPARGGDRFRNRKPVGGPRHAVVPGRALHGRALSRGRLRRLRGRPRDGPSARARHRGRALPRFRQRRRRALARRARGDRPPDDRGRAVAVRAVRRVRRGRARAIVGSVERGLAGRGRGRAHRRDHGGQAPHRRARRSAQARQARPRRARVPQCLVRLSEP